MNSIENTECAPIGNMPTKNADEQGNTTRTISGIYKIINKVNGKYYVGSSKSIKRRLGEHRTYLRGNRHYNRHLQSSWNEYGEGAFAFTIVETCQVDMLMHLEQKYLNTSNRYNSYNTSFIADRPEMTAETRSKISNSHKGKVISPDTRQKLREKSLGRKFPKSFSEKMSKIVTGRKHSDETKQKLREIFSGKNSYFYGRGPLVMGSNNPVYNHTIYTFNNETNGECFTGTQHQFRTKYHLDNGNVSRLVNNKQKSVLGWVLTPSSQPI